ncbi:MAG: asparagine synthase (glutamine-hydrolyzing) [Chitinophagaceae bacterium]
MCGIAGVVSKNKQDVQEHTIRRMTDSIRHRGPDGEGIWISNDAVTGLGHRRLSIIDLSEAGNQPMHYMGRYSLVFNGEIYNYLELRQLLEQKGYSFVSKTDTEVIMALYDWKGAECLQFFDGMFSLALYDDERKELFCARDRFGEKPFFYFYEPQNERFFFASEMKALWAAGIPREVNNKMVYGYLAFQQERNPCDSTATFFNNIYKLPLAHSLKLSIPGFKLNISKYWDIEISNKKNEISEVDAINRFTELFYDAVNKRLRSDVPVGTSLSGGLDSSVIIKTIQEIDDERNTGINRNSFSAQFPEYEKDESYYQNLVAKETNVIQHIVRPDTESMLGNIDKIFFHQEEPFGSNSICAQYEVYKMARENNVIVLLDGQGADEILGGYPGEYYLPFFKGLKNKRVFISQLHQYRKLHKNNKINPYFPLFVQAILPQKVTNVIRKVTKPAEDYTWLNKDFITEYKSEAGVEKRPGNLDAALYKSTFKGGLETLLRYADRNSMANSVEVRLPFLSHQLAEFVFSLPDTMKINAGWTKWIARKVFDKKLPEEIIWRKEKVGFEPPDRNLSKLANHMPLTYYFHDNNVKPFLAKETIEKMPSHIAWRIIMLWHLLNNAS